MGMALRSVADDRDGLPVERRRIRVGVVVHARSHRLTASSIDDDPRLMTTAPVLTSSLIPYVRTSATNCVDLALRAGDLDDHRLPRQVDDPALRQLDELQDLGPIGVGRPDLDEGQLLGDDRVRRDVLDLQDVDQPVELLGGLLDRDVVAVEGDRHPAHVGLVGPADGERVDVEVPRPHQRRDAVQDARLVEDDRDEGVAAGLAAAGQGTRRRRGVGRRRPRAIASPARDRWSWPSPLTRPRPSHFSIRSDRPLPAGIIGKTFCSSAISNQIERRAVDRLGGADRVVDLVGLAGLEGRDAEGVGELGEVRAEQVRGVVVAARR